MKLTLEVISTKKGSDEMTTSLVRIKPTLSEIKESLQEIYGDRLAYITLYGSQARNEETHSDIDILVVLQGNVESCIE
jgi:predicted nucleotidyltransferase